MATVFKQAFGNIGIDTSSPTQKFDVNGNIRTRGGYTIRKSESDPTASDIDEGHFQVWKNTTTNEVRLWANNGGILLSVPLQ